MLKEKWDHRKKTFWMRKERNRAPIYEVIKNTCGSKCKSSELWEVTFGFL